MCRNDNEITILEVILDELYSKYRCYHYEGIDYNYIALCCEIKRIETEIRFRKFITD